MAFTIVIDYFAGLQIEKATGKTRRNYLIISIAANVLVLAIFKYYNFLNDNFTWLLNNGGYHNPIPYLSILLPIGLSFHTFQAMSYTIEVYRGKQKAEKHFGIYALYVMFYPQLVAGPIERPQNILHQFKVEHYFNYERATRGLRFMLWGFFLKIVIADNMALVANNVFDKYEHMGGLATLIGTMAFTIQIFCDFAGYSSIAIGAALVMGFTLMANFRQPYLAASVSDFWSRWHISLSTWFKDYLYIPLGGNRVEVPRWCLNILIVFAISGLWHGASWTFLIWGVLHGLLLIIERISKPLRNMLASAIGLNKLPIFTRIIKTLIVLVLVSIAWIFFRAETLHQAIFMIRNLFEGNYIANDGRNAISPWGADTFSKFPILAALFILALEQFYREFGWKTGSVAVRRNLYLRWSIYLFLLFTIFLFGAYQGVRFIYFQF
ncbi:MBOAT family O-acyltransferase [Mucilaginibacter pedocola]|nr:MBOAT family O-acyltransferase [Mucilaginibacter pedocola]